jgi:hypothetical protein
VPKLGPSPRTDRWSGPPQRSKTTRRTPRAAAVAGTIAMFPRCALVSPRSNPGSMANYQPRGTRASVSGPDPSGATAGRTERDCNPLVATAKLSSGERHGWSGRLRGGAVPSGCSTAIRLPCSSEGWVPRLGSLARRAVSLAGSTFLLERNVEALREAAKCDRRASQRHVLGACESVTCSRRGNSEAAPSSVGTMPLGRDLACLFVPLKGNAECHAASW